MQENTWRLDELLERAAAAIRGLGVTPVDARVSLIPDRRTVRWYQTCGLLDRPTYEGRVALYGPRHLLQVVAIKAMQARGRSLAAIQAELMGAPDERLRAAGGGAPAPSPPPPAPAPPPQAARLGDGLLLVLDPDVNPAWSDPDRVAAVVALLRRALLDGEI